MKVNFNRLDGFGSSSLILNDELYSLLLDSGVVVTPFDDGSHTIYDLATIVYSIYLVDISDLPSSEIPTFTSYFHSYLYRLLRIRFFSEVSK